ncbi:MAG: helix-turn-helix domain-containing protein [Lentisphaerae bacterium]|nr:helix-turn-helix domain-containing protein [Lentisphaerota bacterium]
MLDFGTDMNEREELNNDELFSQTAVKNSSVQFPEKENSVSGTNSPELPARPRIKPPVLPKYNEPPAPKAAVQPVLRNNPHFLHRRRKAEEFSTEDKMEVSRILKAARTAAGLTREDVESSTQIRAHYLAALEEADYDKLPQPVYVLAYLRKLCELYDIPREEEEQLVRPWRNIPCELPENLPAAVQPDNENPDRRMIFRLEIILFASGALIIGGIIVLIVVLIVSYFSGKTMPAPVFDNEKLLEIQDTPRLNSPDQPSLTASGR